MNHQLRASCFELASAKRQPAGGHSKKRGTHRQVVPVADVPAAGVVPEPVEGVLPPRPLRRQHRRVGRRCCDDGRFIYVSAHRSFFLFFFE